MISQSRWSRWAARFLKKDIDELDSPLLHLPAELRIKIWTYVLGDRLIIINSTKVFGSPQPEVSDENEMPEYLQRAEHRLRRIWGRVFRMLEPRAVNTFEKYRAFKQHLRGYTKAVEFCAASDEPRRPCSAIDLNILRTSRQIYEEAFHILWTANAFMFHQPATFRKFTGSLSVAQRHTLARVYIIASIDYRANQAYCWDRELGAHLAKKLPALQRLAVHLKLKADPWRCPWIDLNDFHTSSTINALSCLQEVPKIKLKVSLDRNYDTTRFMFPNRLFDDPTSPYHRLINTKEGSGTVFFLHDDDLMMVLEVFYEAFILNQPDVDDVKAEYEAEILARQPVAAFAMKRGPEIWLGITPRRLGLGFEF